MDGDNKDVGQAVKVYKALGEPTRLKIALLLADGEKICAAPTLAASWNPWPAQRCRTI